MFVSGDLKKFKYFLLNNWRSEAQVFQSRYVFLEDCSKILSLHETSIATQSFQSATGKTITIWADQYGSFPNFHIANILYEFIRFKSVLEIKNINGLDLTFLGRYDLNLITLTGATSSDSLAPSIVFGEQIYITDLTTKSSPTYFIEQFVPDLWIAFLITFLLCGIILDFGSWFLNQFIFRPFTSFIWFAIVTQQGGYEPHSNRYRKIILISLAMLTIIFHGSFEAFMSSSLAIRNMDLPFSDLNGLLNAKDYTICTIPNTSPYFYMQRHQIRERYNTIDCPRYFREFNPVSQSSMSKLTRCPNGKFAYMGLGAYWSNEWNGKCNFIPLAEKYFLQYITIQVSPGFKYREQFNAGILRLRSSGQLQHLLMRQYELGYFTAGLKHGRYQHIDILENNSQPIDLSQIILILLALIIGFVSSILVLIVEVLIKSKVMSVICF